MIPFEVRDLSDSANDHRRFVTEKRKAKIELTSGSRDDDLSFQLADGIPCAALDNNFVSWSEGHDVVLNRVAWVICQGYLFSPVSHEKPGNP